MITVTWKTADGRQGDAAVAEDDKWTVGRGGGSEQPDLVIDDPAVSRVALVVRDSGPGPVVFRGQRDNGARVGLVSLIGSTRWLDEGTAGNLTATESRVELEVDGRVLLTIDVTFDDRGTVAERQAAADR